MRAWPFLHPTCRYGNLDAIYTGYTDALAGNTTVSGVGITMEGIWTNYPIFEATLLLGWQQAGGGAGSVPEYWADYGRRRYGQPTAGATAAWELLGAAVYSGKALGREGLIEHVPSPGKLAGLLDDAAAAAAITAITAAASDNCSFTEVANSFLYRVAPGYSSKAYNRSSLAAAEAWCCEQGPSCGGITFEPKTREYQARAACTPDSKATHETSWHKATCANPDPGPPKPRPPPGPPAPPRPPAQPAVARAWKALLSEASTLGGVPSYRYDLVDLAREQLEHNFSARAAAFGAACGRRDPTAAAAASAAVLDLLDDYDAILSSDPNFMVGTWIAWARSPEWSNVSETRDWLEFNARNQITLWGPSGQINDYAAKSWGGLVRDYYKPRWQLFLTKMLAAVPKDAAPFDGAAFSHELLRTIEEPWSNATNPFPTVAEHDAVALAQQLYSKYLAT